MAREPKMSRYIALFFAIWIGGGFALSWLLRMAGVEGAGVFASVIMFGVGFVGAITPFGRAQVRYHSGAHGEAHGEHASHGASEEDAAEPDEPGPVHAAVPEAKVTASAVAEPEDGWLPDPTRRHQLRYRGVNGWTDLVRDGNFSSNDPFDPSEALGA
jgi:hypothetical protein